MPNAKKHTRRTATAVATALSALLLTAALTACSPTATALTYFPKDSRTQARAACIIKRESGGNPSAISPTRDYGLFQINRAAHKQTFQNRYGVPFETGALRTDLNARYARYLFDYYRARGQDGFTPWNGGRYAC